MIEGMRPDQAIRIIIEDLRRFIDFDDDDIDLAKTYLQMNDRDPLFLNEVGSEPWRPQTRTEISNLFLAGDFVDNDIGVVTVEGAVFSGLCAARAVQAQAQADRNLSIDALEMKDISVLLPYTYPLVNAQLLKLSLSAHAACAKLWSRSLELTENPDRAYSPEQLTADLEAWLGAPAAMTADLSRIAVSSAQWLARLPYGDN
jgi:hypothetical protein